MSWQPYFHIAAKRPWPEVVRMVRPNTKEMRRYVPERTCKVVKETVDVDGERMTDYTCGCCNQSGWNHKYCPNCGAKVVDE